MPNSVDRARLLALLAAAPAQRVAVVGDAMLDVYLRGDVERISPEAPVPVVRVREQRFALGGAANVAQNVAAAGARAELVAAVADDEAGRGLRIMLDNMAADTAALVAVNRPTTRKTRVLASDDDDVMEVDYDDEGNKVVG